jgi:hypothetical protein
MDRGRVSMIDSAPLKVNSGDSLLILVLIGYAVSGYMIESHEATTVDDSQEYMTPEPTQLDRKRKSLQGRIRKDLLTFVQLGDPNRSFARYERLARAFKLRCRTDTERQYLDDLLGDICRHEHEHGRPMLSIVVVNDELKPGPGFFVLARELKRQKPEEGDDAFISRERAELFEYWGSHKDPIRKERRESRSQGK